MNGQKKAENDLEYELFHLEMAWIIFECLKIQEFCLNVDFMQATHYIHFVILQWFWLIFWQKMVLKTPKVNFFHVKNVQTKFQLKIPTLSKNDCSATWNPNTNQKNFMPDLLRNVQRCQKYVPIFRVLF